MAGRLANRTLVIALAALAVAAILGYWGYGAYQARELGRAFAATIGDVNARLRDALDAAAGPAPADRARTVQKLDDHLAATDRQLAALRRLDASRMQALADAADNYLVTAREILKRQADRERYRLLLAGSLQALREHMRADNRSGAWVRQAVEARERVNKDYRGYQLAAETAGRLLESLGAAQKAVAPHVDPAALLPDALIAGARKAVADDSARVAAEMQQVRRMAGPR